MRVCKPPQNKDFKKKIREIYKEKDVKFIEAREKQNQNS